MGDDLSFRHAPFLPAPPRGRSARCDGYAGASRRPGGRLTSGPSRPGRACSRALLGAHRDPGGVPWVALRHPRDGDFCSWSCSSACRFRPIAGASRSAMQLFSGRQFPAIAATWGWRFHVPSQAATAALCARSGSGIEPAPQTPPPRGGRRNATGLDRPRRRARRTRQAG